MINGKLPTLDSQLVVNGELAGWNGHIIVDLPSGTTATAGVASQQVQARIIAPDRSQQTVALQPSAPGRCERNSPATQVGGYLMRVTWQEPNSSNTSFSNQLSTTSGLVV